MALRPAVFDHQILTFDITGFLQSLAECAQKVCGQIGLRLAEKPDHRRGWLLGTRRERPCDRRAAEKGDELAPHHGPPLGSQQGIISWLKIAYLKGRR